MAALKRKQDRSLPTDRKKPKVDSPTDKKKPTNKSTSKHLKKAAQQKADESDEWDDTVGSSEDEDYGGISVNVGEEEQEEKDGQDKAAIDLDKSTKDDRKGEKTEEEGMFDGDKTT
jgi:hypothetical protein